MSVCPYTSVCAPTNKQKRAHVCVREPPGPAPACAHLVQGGDKANALMLLPTLRQALAQEVPIVLALPEEAPPLLEVELAETQTWACLFGGVPCHPSLSPVGLGSSQLPQQCGSQCPLTVPFLLAPCLSFPFAARAITHVDVGEPGLGACMAGDGQGWTMLAGVIPPPQNGWCGIPSAWSCTPGETEAGSGGDREAVIPGGGTPAGHRGCAAPGSHPSLASSARGSRGSARLRSLRDGRAELARPCPGSRHPAPSHPSSPLPPSPGISASG